MLAAIILMFCSMASAQTQKYDIASFVPPPNWQRVEAADSLTFVTGKTDLSSFCVITLYPSMASSGNVTADFELAWNHLVVEPAKSKVRPRIEGPGSDAGWQIMSGNADVTQDGKTFVANLTTVTGFGKTMSFLVKAKGSEYGPAVLKFFDDMKLDEKAAPANVGQGVQQTGVQGPVSMRDYAFIAPPNWQVQAKPDHILLQNVQSGCLIQIFVPLASSGDLAKDAVSTFEMMYQGWGYQKFGRERHKHSTGFTPQGLEYFMMEATMSRTGPDQRYDLQEGAALIVKAGAQKVIIAVRHNSSMLGHDECKRYTGWRRFFNSFAVKNTPVAQNSNDAARRIVGKWSMAESGATGEYLFAANGNYGLVGAIGSSSTSRDADYEYFTTRATAFQGIGSYSIAGNQITLRKRGHAPELMQFRFEKVNYGGTGWVDRLYLLSKDAKGEYESAYEKQNR